MAEDKNSTDKPSCCSCGQPGGSSCGRFWIVLVALIAVAAIIYWRVAGQAAPAEPSPEAPQTAAGVGDAGAVATQVPWGHDYQAALATAQQSGKPILMVFHANWCGPCRQMKATTYKDPTVIAKIASFVPVYVDVDEQGDIAQQFEVGPIPHYVILSSAGKEVERFVGFRPSADFIAALDEALKKV